ncbi:MAG: HutD family protein [Psychrilyobacter sp.]|uniref:HutD family protein n=1 Tax=Psychrilyobacter sp. TaxID=2586924 RepID=UPI003C726AF1
MQTIVNYETLKSKKWNGGKTKEYFKDKDDFGIRISSATIDQGVSEFSDFTGYKRMLSILKNSVELNINGIFKTMNKDSVIQFEGSDKVLSKCDNEIIDFNVIWKEKDFIVKMNRMERDEKIIIDNNIFIISLVHNNAIMINNSKIFLNKYDGYINTENDLKRIQPSNKCLVVNFIKKKDSIN